jgi:hypothetical protein
MKQKENKNSLFRKMQKEKIWFPSIIELEIQAKKKDDTLYTNTGSTVNANPFRCHFERQSKQTPDLFGGPERDMLPYKKETRGNGGTKQEMIQKKKGLLLGYPLFRPGPWP